MQEAEGEIDFQGYAEHIFTEQKAGVCLFISTVRRGEGRERYPTSQYGLQYEGIVLTQNTGHPVIHMDNGLPFHTMGTPPGIKNLSSLRRD